MVLERYYLSFFMFDMLQMTFPFKGQMFNFSIINERVLI